MSQADASARFRRMRSCLGVGAGLVLLSSCTQLRQAPAGEGGAFGPCEPCLGGGGLGGASCEACGAAGSGASGAFGPGGGGEAGAAGAPFPGLTDVGALPSVPCELRVQVELAALPLVAQVELGTDLEDESRAFVQFGPPGRYLYEAPVRREGGALRTLLVGLGAQREYRYRAFVQNSTGICASAEGSLTTGALAAGSPRDVAPSRGPSVEAAQARYVLVPQRGYGTILNTAGEVVWAYNFGSVVSMVLSWDGRYVIARDAGVFDAGQGGSVWRVPLEGGKAELLPLSGGSHHDITVTESGIAYIAKLATGECDHIFLADHDGSNSRPWLDLEPFLANFPKSEGRERCHVNAIAYSPSGRFFTVSDRQRNVVLKISAAGELLASIGQAPEAPSELNVVAEGVGSIWTVQHGHDWYEPHKFVVFSNGTFAEQRSRVLHYTVSGASASLDWSLDADYSPTFSNVVHLGAGHFLVYAAATGQLREVDSSGATVWELNAGGGYARPRASLYGSPSGETPP